MYVSIYDLLQNFFAYNFKIMTDSYVHVIQIICVQLLSCNGIIINNSF